MIHLFVYGTLIFDKILEALLDKKNIQKENAILKDYQIYSIVEKNNQLKPYPAIKYCKGSSVEGYVIYNLTPEDIKTIDWYEDESIEFKRKIVNIILKNSLNTIEAYTYIYIKENTLIPGWDKNLFKKRYLNLYIKSIKNRNLENL